MEPGTVLRRILIRAANSRLHGKVELYFKDGILQDHFKIEATVRGAASSTEELDEKLAVSLPSPET